MFHPRLLNANLKIKKKPITYIYGWKKDLIDHRDYNFLLSSSNYTVDRFLLNLQCPIFDQLNISSCVANALSICLMYMYKNNKNVDIPSRLFIYYIARILDNNVNADNGCTFRSAIKAIKNWGSCYEKQWPYITNNTCIRPHSLCFSSIPRFNITRYERLPCSPSSWEHCLSVLKKPFVFGILLYSSFFSSKSGNIKLPNFNLETCVGGHALVATGYDKNNQILFFQNSWGITWGNKGCGTIPYQYLTSKEAMADIWVIY